MKKLPLIFIPLLFNLVVYSQQTSFQRVYDFGYAETGYDIKQTFEGGYIITGRQGISIGTTNLLLLKTDSLGYEEWHKFIAPTLGEAEGNSVLQTADSGFIIVGYITLPNKSADVYLVKTDMKGDTLWTKNYGNSDSEKGLEILSTFDGGFIISANKQNKGWILKTDQFGDTLWTNSYVPLNNNGFTHSTITQTIDSGYAISGVVTDTVGQSNFYVVRTNVNGDTLWTKIYPGQGAQYCERIRNSKNNGFIIVGISKQLVGWDNDIKILSIDSIGDTLWIKMYGGINDDGGYSITKTSDEGFVIAGVGSSFGNGNYDAYLIKINDTGEIIWFKTFGDSNSDYTYSVVETNDFGFALIGGKDPGDVYFIKTDNIGLSNVGIENSIENLSEVISVYPNPFCESINLRFISKVSGEFEAKLYDITGRIVILFPSKKIVNGINNISFNTNNNLTSGIYFLKIYVFNKVYSLNIIHFVK